MNTATHNHAMNAVEVHPAPGSPALFCVTVTHAGVRLRSCPFTSKGRASDFAWVAERELAKPVTNFFRKWTRVDAPAELAADGTA